MEKPADQGMKSAVRLPLVLQGPGAESALEAIRLAFDLGETLSMSVTDQVFRKGETLLYVRYVREVALEGKELKEADGTIIQMPGSLTLRFDSKGVLKSFTKADIGVQALKSQKEELLRLMAAGRVYFAAPGEEVNVAQLNAAKKDFCIWQDQDGKKRLKKVYV